MATLQTKETDKATQQVVAKANQIATNKGRYRYTELLGEGGFGKVLKAVDTRAGGNRIVAVKHLETKRSLMEFLFVKTPESAQQARKEAELMTELKHENVIGVLDSFNFNTIGGKTIRLAIVMDYCKANLHDHLEENFVSKETRLDKMDRLTWYQQLAAGLEYIHSKNIIHRDLKPLNILISTTGTLKIADVGLAKVIHDSEGIQSSYEKYLTLNHAGTPVFVPPETYTDYVPGMGISRYESDVFSMGLIMYLMCELPPDLCPVVQGMAIGEYMVTYPQIVANKSPTSVLDSKFKYGTREEREIFDQMLQSHFSDRPRADKVVEMLKSVREKWEPRKRRRNNEQSEAEQKDKSWFQRATDYLWSFFS